MRRIGLVLALGLNLAPLVAEAQPAGKIPRIGILRPGSPPDPLVEAFRQGLHELGYAEGRNISIEYRWAEGRDERLPSLAVDLVRLKVDVIVAGQAASCRPPRRAAHQVRAGHQPQDRESARPHDPAVRPRASRPTIGSWPDSKRGATFYTSDMEHPPTNATGTGWEPTPWHATQRAAWAALDLRRSALISSSCLAGPTAR